MHDASMAGTWLLGMYVRLLGGPYLFAHSMTAMHVWLDHGCWVCAAAGWALLAHSMTMLLYLRHILCLFPKN